VPTAQASLLDEFESRIHPKDFDELFEAEPSKLLAQALGLEHYDWLSFNYIARDLLDSSGDHPDVTEVN
jgi:hypothetical protein